MPSKFNSEFNYRYQVIGETPWEKIKILKGFLEGRINAAKLEEQSKLRYEIQLKKIKYLKETNAAEHDVLQAEYDAQELAIHHDIEKEAFELNRQEVEMLQQLLAEHYELVEHTRLPGYTDEQMFELNAANEFTATIAKDIYTEIISTGRPSATKIRNAMSNPHTFKALQVAGLLPHDMAYMEGNADPLQISLKITPPDQLTYTPPSVLKLEGK
jgi:hypothetical protein